MAKLHALATEMMRLTSFAHAETNVKPRATANTIVRPPVCVNVIPKPHAVTAVMMRSCMSQHMW